MPPEQPLTLRLETRPTVDPLSRERLEARVQAALAALVRQQEARLQAVSHARLATLREVITDTGALARVEALIEERAAAALAALESAPVHPSAFAALAELASAATARRG